jgi:hypothetical protein
MVAINDCVCSITFYYDVGDKDGTTLKLALSITDDEVGLNNVFLGWFIETFFLGPSETAQGENDSMHYN